MIRGLIRGRSQQYDGVLTSRDDIWRELVAAPGRPLIGPRPSSVNIGGKNKQLVELFSLRV